MHRKTVSLSAAQIAKKFAAQREAKTEKKLVQQLRHALSKFKPRKSERGTLQFIGVQGSRDAGSRGRRGFLIYVNRKGRKVAIRQRERGKLVRVPTPRHLSGLDIPRAAKVPHTATKKFRQKYLANEKARKALALETPESGQRIEPPKKRGKRRSLISSTGTRFVGRINADRIDGASKAVAKLAKELRSAIQGVRSKKDFLVTIGIAIQKRNGETIWIFTERRFSRRDNQEITLAQTHNFFAREIYSFIAKELADRGLVLAGSARHIARLKDNRGKKRSKWKKDGYLWQGHDMDDVKILWVEWRFDQLIFTK